VFNFQTGFTAKDTRTDAKLINKNDDNAEPAPMVRDGHRTRFNFKKKVGVKDLPRQNVKKMPSRRNLVISPKSPQNDPE
jgi:hypothetical protein